jgi:hypothetical protein
MEYIECPASLDFENGRNVVFMAGGITGCGNWQQDMRTMLEPAEIILINPRRIEWPKDVSADSALAREQIEWEWRAFMKSKAVLFWFPPETLCPIALFELGKITVRSGTALFVGCDPNYKRKFDVTVQLALERPSVKVVDSLDELSGQVIEWSNGLAPSND